MDDEESIGSDINSDTNNYCDENNRSGSKNITVVDGNNNTHINRKEKVVVPMKSKITPTTAAVILFIHKKIYCIII